MYSYWRMQIVIAMSTNWRAAARATTPHAPFRQTMPSLHKANTTRVLLLQRDGGNASAVGVVCVSKLCLFFNVVFLCIFFAYCCCSWAVRESECGQVSGRGWATRDLHGLVTSAFSASRMHRRPRGSTHRSHAHLPHC